MKKLGRSPRAFDPAIPHMSMMAMRVDLKPPPRSVDWTAGMNIPWGQMLNDELGDCTIAGAYHFMQLCSAHGRRQVLTEPDNYILQAYEEFTGYVPHDPSTDNGAIEQDILRQWMHWGVPIKEGTARTPGPGRSKIMAYVEVDPRSHEDVKRAINDCAAVYVGFQVPAWLMSASAPKLWNSGTNDQIVGGHCVICPGYNKAGPQVVSWGEGDLRMTWAFWDRYVDEAYAIVHPWWVDATGRTPLGLPVEDLEKLMAAIKRRRPA